ncbi:MAG: radical SAM domain-containing protein [Desulfobulbaceae bacterium]|jgi:hypothetical protein|nr:radical SAM domain-containing protein [Desulfobulbaceae bacterium]
MTVSWENNYFAVRLGVIGARRYEKVSYPLYYGEYGVIETASDLLHFNREHEIIRAQGKGESWPHRNEWLKRSLGDDWLYYSTGGYTGVFETLGEFYLPNLPYPTNNLLGGHPLRDQAVRRVIDGWPRQVAACLEQAEEAPEAVKIFLRTCLAKTPEKLAAKSVAIFANYGGRPSVLPPDARHVDYQLIPVNIASGCLYKCRFCEVKNRTPFRAALASEVSRQMVGVKELVGADLANYGAVFLGDHDALAAGGELILATLGEAYELFQLKDSLMYSSSAFFFASVASLSAAGDDFFARLARLPYDIYINIGLESADQETLHYLGKPLAAREVEETFARMQALNDRYPKLELTANFVFDDDLPTGHYPAFLKLVRDSLPRRKVKGSVYLSPLKFDQPSRLKTFDFNRLKRESRLPVFLYLIQRL